MITILKKTGFIAIVSFLFFLAGYTASMGLVFSFAGMWQDEPGLMAGYASVFLLTATIIFLFITRDWLESWKR